MSASVDILHPDRPKRVVIVASNPAVSDQTGWPIGFWWAELTHPYLEFTEHAVRDGNLITAQQQYSGRAAARLMIEALGV